MSTVTQTEIIKNPGSYRIAGSTRGLFFLLVIIGIASFAGGYAEDPSRAWAAYLQNHFYFMSIAILALFFAAIQWVTSSMWSAPVRRLMEAFTAYLPYAVVTSALLYFGIEHLYIWSHATHVQGDVVLEGKSGYLSPWFFMVRTLGVILIWTFFGSKFIGNSIAQDQSKDPKLTLKNRGLAPAFFVIFGLTYTIASFDQMMSVDPHWYSTMFGVYCFAGGFYAFLAAHCLLTVYFYKSGRVKGIVNENHLHDIGKFMFAFTIFWAYIAFAQFFLIWYANMPEETLFYIHRLEGGWLAVSLFLIAKFAVPFFVLLPREAKRNPAVLVPVAVFMLVAHWIDILWIVQPEFSKTGPRFGYVEIGVLLGFIGLFGLAISRFLGRHSIVAIGDPRLKESVFHHHQ